MKLTWTTGVLLFSLWFALPSAEARSHKKKPSLVDEATQALDEALVKAPVDQEVCFSPEEPCAIKLKKFIESAQKSIDVAIYDINQDSITHALLVQAHKINVRIVVDRRQAKGGHSLVPLLIKAGAQIRYGHQRGIMHNKFTVVDGHMLETGSFNYTHHATQANNENQLYLANPTVLDRYTRRFAAIWAAADPVQ